MDENLDGASYLLAESVSHLVLKLGRIVEERRQLLAAVDEETPDTPTPDEQSPAAEEPTAPEETSASEAGGVPEADGEAAASDATASDADVSSEAAPESAAPAAPSGSASARETAIAVHSGSAATLIHSSERTATAVPA